MTLVQLIRENSLSLLVYNISSCLYKCKKKYLGYLILHAVGPTGFEKSRGFMRDPKVTEHNKFVFVFYIFLITKKK